MTIDQLRDQLAEAMEWKRLKDLPTFWRRGGGKERDRNTHPVELSLDWLAAHGLPEGWEYRAIFFHTIAVQDCPVCCVVGKDSTTRDVFAPTELHARLSACVAAWKANKEGTQ